MSQIITHDEDGFLNRAQGTTGTKCEDLRAGFVFHSAALQIAQNSVKSHAWARFPDLEGVTPTASEKRPTLAQLRARALAALQGA